MFGLDLGDSGGCFLWMNTSCAHRCRRTSHPERLHPSLKRRHSLLPPRDRGTSPRVALLVVASGPIEAGWRTVASVHADFVRVEPLQSSSPYTSAAELRAHRHSRRTWRLDRE